MVRSNDDVSVATENTIRQTIVTRNDVRPPTHPSCPVESFHVCRRSFRRWLDVLDLFPYTGVVKIVPCFLLPSASATTLFCARRIPRTMISPVMGGLLGTGDSISTASSRKS